MERATIVYNPNARNAPSLERLASAAGKLPPQGWEVALRSTEAPGHGIELARDAASTGSSVVFACGGDGTLNEVVNGLVGTDTAVAVIRGGMGNVFAKEIGVPRRVEKALEVLVAGEKHRFDLGLAGGRHFLLMAGLGLDATVVQQMPATPKRLLGSSSYALWGAVKATSYRPHQAQLRIDGEPWEGELYWLLLGNTRSYGGVLDITANARADDGRLDAYVFSGAGIGWTLNVAVRIVLRRQDEAPGVTYQQVRHLDVLTPGIPVQGDGEYFGETPMGFSVIPEALTVLMPAGRGKKLLAEASSAEGTAEKPS